MIPPRLLRTGGRAAARKKYDCEKNGTAGCQPHSELRHSRCSPADADAKLTPVTVSYNLFPLDGSHYASHSPLGDASLQYVVGRSRHRLQDLTRTPGAAACPAVSSARDAPPAPRARRLVGGRFLRTHGSHTACRDVRVMRRHLPVDLSWRTSSVHRMPHDDGRQRWAIKSGGQR